LAKDARVFVEAYRRTNWMRFDFGTVAQVVAPPDLRLTTFDSHEGVLFRVRVTATANNQGQLLATADQISPVHKDQEGEEGREPLLPIKPADLGEEVYRVDLSDAPLLLVSNQFGDWRALARSPLFVCMALPQALREILTRILRVEKYFETDDPSNWCARWLKFAATRAGSSDPPKEGEEDRFDEWVDDAVSAFARMHGIKSRFNAYWSGGAES
jgi:hypothetical protein